MKHTELPWEIGYEGGVTGPSTPVMCPTVREVVAFNAWVDEGERGPCPDIQYTVLRKGKKVLAIIPTNDEEGMANAQLLFQAISRDDAWAREIIADQKKTIDEQGQKMLRLERLASNRYKALEQIGDILREAELLKA